MIDYILGFILFAAIIFLIIFFTTQSNDVDDLDSFY